MLQLLTRTQAELAQCAADMKLDGIKREFTPGGDGRIGQPMPDTFDDAGIDPLDDPFGAYDANPEVE